MKIDWVAATDADRKYLLWLRLQTMVEHLERDGLFYTEQQHLAKLNEDYECAHILWNDGIKSGLLKFRIRGKQLDIMQIQIDPAQQKKGLGRAVLRLLLDYYPEHTAVLTVLKHNPAQRLYLQLGFEKTGEDQFEYHMQRLPPSP